MLSFLGAHGLGPSSQSPGVPASDGSHVPAVAVACGKDRAAFQVACFLLTWDPDAGLGPSLRKHTTAV